MKKFFILILSCTLFSGFIFSAPAPLNTPLPVATLVPFPELKATSLDNLEVDLTAAAKDKITLFVLGFERKDQKDLDAWLDPFIKAAATDKVFTFFEVPMIDGGFAQLFAGFMQDGFKKLLSKEKASQAYLFFGDKSKYIDLLKVTNTSDIQVFLTDKKTNIIWSATGAPDAVKLQALFSAMANSQK